MLKIYKICTLRIGYEGENNTIDKTTVWEQQLRDWSKQFLPSVTSGKPAGEEKKKEREKPR